MAALTYDQFTLDAAGDVIAGTLTGVKLGLYQNVLDISKDRVLADFTAAKCTFTSYVKTVLVWDAVSMADDGSIESVSAQLTFRPTDAVNPNVVQGAWIEDGAAAKLYMAVSFPAPKPPMNSALDVLKINVRYKPKTDMFDVSLVS